MVLARPVSFPRWRRRFELTIGHCSLDRQMRQGPTSQIGGWPDFASAWFYKMRELPQGPLCCWTCRQENRHKQTNLPKEGDYSLVPLSDRPKILSAKAPATKLQAKLNELSAGQRKTSAKSDAIAQGLGAAGQDHAPPKKFSALARTFFFDTIPGNDEQTVLHHHRD